MKMFRQEAANERLKVQIIARPVDVDGQHQERSFRDLPNSSRSGKSSSRRDGSTGVALSL